MGSITKMGILGSVSGKVGNVVVVDWKGKTFLRESPGERSTKPSELEKSGWSDFAMLHYWLKPILKFLRAGFNGYPGRVHAFNAAKSLALKNAFTGNRGSRVFDPALVQVTWGDLQLPTDATVLRTGDLELTFNWGTNLTTEGASQYDQAMLLAYDPVQKLKEWNITGQFRSAGSDKLILDEKGSYHVYIGFVAADRSRQSASVYLGMVEID